MSDIDQIENPEKGQPIVGVGYDGDPDPGNIAVTEGQISAGVGGSNEKDNETAPLEDEQTQADDPPPPTIFPPGFKPRGKAGGGMSGGKPK